MFGKILRYGAGALAGWLVFIVQGVVVYLGLFVYALITNAPLGGPLAGPFMILLAAVLGAILVPVLYVPAVVSVEIARKWGAGHRVLIAGIVVAVLVGIVVAIAAPVTEVSALNFLIAWLIALASVLLPAIAAAVTVYGSSALAAVLRRWRSSGQLPTIGGHRAIRSLN